MRIALLLALLHAGPAAPTSAALQRAWSAARPALVSVHGPHRSGAGFLVSAQGQVLTTVDFVGLDEAEVRYDGHSLPARVTIANARLRLAVLTLAPAPGLALPSLAARVTALRPGDWVIGVERGPKGQLTPHLGQVLFAATEKNPFVRTDLSASPGTPLLDPRGNAVALVVGRQGAGARALPLDRVRSELRAEAPAHE